MKVKNLVLAALLAISVLVSPAPAQALIAPESVTVVATHRPLPPVTTPATHRAPVTPLWVRKFAHCVIGHETKYWPYNGHPRPYKAVRGDTGTASGAYQFINSTWRAKSRAAGYPGYSRAYLAPPRVQDAVFYYTVMHGGLHNWNGTHCGYGT